jgi:hypothetical protein
VRDLLEKDQVEAAVKTAAGWAKRLILPGKDHEMMLGRTALPGLPNFRFSIKSSTRKENVP